MIIPDEFKRTVRFPVRFMYGTWMLLDGTPLPKIKEEAIGDLILSAWAIVDAKERARWTREGEGKLFSEKTVLWVRVRDEKIPPMHRSACKERKVWPGEPTRVVAVELMEDLMLLERSGKPGTLKPCLCRIPALDRKTKSLNEAYTVVSAEFEPSRRSHTGNVFKYVFYEDDDYLHPLENRRMKAEVAGAPAKAGAE